MGHDAEGRFGVDAGYVDSLFDVAGLSVVITGAGSGLGEAIGRGFALAGARASLLDVNEDNAQEVAGQLSDSGCQAVGLKVDVTKREDLERSLDQVGQVDVLVNSAGWSYRSPAEDFPEAEYDRIIDLNLKGSFRACQVFGRQMLARGAGSIINVASIGATVAYPHTSAYLQSKGGVAQLTRSLALEWIDRGVRVNAIAPSLFDTPLVRHQDENISETSKFIMDRTPIGRRGLPREVVGPAIFLASTAASMVTGHILQVDGGYLIS